MDYIFITCLIFMMLESIYSRSVDLLVTNAERIPRQVNVQRRPDGTIVGSFSLANAIDLPMADNAFAVSNSFEIGPKGFSSASASAFDSDVLGNKMSFANSQAQNSVLGGGMSSANAMANSFSNPLFSGSNSNANSFSNLF